MKNYRKQKSMYILHSCYLLEEIAGIRGITTLLLENKTSQTLLIVKDKINKIISTVDKLPIYGKGGLKERKTKATIYFEHKAYILDELKTINIQIIEATNASRDRISKGANVLEKINEFNNFIYQLQVYWYENKTEKKLSNRYSGLFETLKKKKTTKRALNNHSHIHTERE